MSFKNLNAQYIKNYFKSSFINLKLVFSNWKYILLFFIIGIGFYIFNILLPQVLYFSSILKTLGFLGFLKFYFLIILEHSNMIGQLPFIFLITISLLISVLFSLIIFKVKFLKSIGKKDKNNYTKIGFLSSIGIFLGILAPACAACGIGLFSVLGLGVIVSSLLPYNGLELSFLSIIILLYSIFSVSKNLTICKIKNIKK